jgi:hypothetical protein
MDRGLHGSRVPDHGGSQGIGLAVASAHAAEVGGGRVMARDISSLARGATGEPTAIPEVGGRL